MTTLDTLPADQVRTLLRTLLARLVGLGRDAQWALYANAWLDGSLMRREFADPVMFRKATPMDFVRDSQAGAGAAAGRNNPAGYALARAFEDAAWAVKYFEDGDYSRAAKFIATSIAGAGLDAEVSSS